MNNKEALKHASRLLDETITILYTMSGYDNQIARLIEIVQELRR